MQNVVADTFVWRLRASFLLTAGRNSTLRPRWSRRGTNTRGEISAHTEMLRVRGSPSWGPAVSNRRDGRGPKGKHAPGIDGLRKVLTLRESDWWKP